jgi:DNA-binding Lrp family transcriptional regulator
MDQQQLLSLLQHNARASTDDLAKELNTTKAAVEQKIAELERDGVVLGYLAVVDPAKINSGNSVTATIEVRITPEREGGFDRLAVRISKFPEVQSCYLMSGGYDLLVVVQGTTLQEVATFISEKLSTIKGVISTATHFRLKSYKENGVLMVREKRVQRLAVTP